jgi:hypothetical protein
MSVFAERGAFGSIIRGDVSLAFASATIPDGMKRLPDWTTSPKK